MGSQRQSSAATQAAIRVRGMERGGVGGGPASGPPPPAMCASRLAS